MSQTYFVWPPSPDEDKEPITQPSFNFDDSRCIECNVELCEELDAYWGEHPGAKYYCVKCRSKYAF